MPLLKLWSKIHKSVKLTSLSRLIRSKTDKNIGLGCIFSVIFQSKTMKVLLLEVQEQNITFTANHSIYIRLRDINCRVYVRIIYSYNTRNTKRLLMVFTMGQNVQVLKQSDCDYLFYGTIINCRMSWFYAMDSSRIE